MSSYSITFEKVAQKFLRKQDSKTQKTLLTIISKLPDGTDIKKLKGFQTLYRVRVGTIRIIFSIDDKSKIINIENIDSRGDVYKNIK